MSHINYILICTAAAQLSSFPGHVVCLFVYKLIGYGILRTVKDKKKVLSKCIHFACVTPIIAPYKHILGQFYNLGAIPEWQITQSNKKYLLEHIETNRKDQNLKFS